MITQAIQTEENVSSQLVMMSLARLVRLAKEAELKTTSRTTPDAPQVVCIRPAPKESPKTPIVLIHPIGGSILPYRDLSRGLQSERAIYGVQSQADEQRNSASYSDIGELADDYINQLQARGIGPRVILGGYSLGGAIAFEMARRMRSRGLEVETILLIDTPARIRRLQLSGNEPVTSEQLVMFGQILAGRFGQQFQVTKAELDEIPALEQIQRVMARLRELKVIGEASGENTYHAVYELARHNEQLQRRFEPQSYDGHVCLVRTLIEAPEIRAEAGAVYDDASFGWQRYCTQPIAIKHVPGSHFEMLYPPFITGLAQALQQFLDELFVS